MLNIIEATVKNSQIVFLEGVKLPEDLKAFVTI
jgi:hypothetical protein